MLSPDKVSAGLVQDWSEEKNTDALDLDNLLAAVRRQWFVVAASVMLAFALGAVYLLTAVPYFTASSSVLIDKGNGVLLSRMSDAGLPVNDEPTVLSEVEVLKSDTISLAVVDKLNLTNNPAFMDGGKSAIASVISMVRQAFDFSSWFNKDSVEATMDERRQRAAAMVEANMVVQRVGKTYVLSIDYTSRSPQLAAQISAAIADVYLTDKLNSKYDATRRASEWLQQRIDELRQQALASDLAVQQFRRDNGLVATSNGGLVSDQQLSELNSALIKAQADTAQAIAKYDRIQSIVDSKRTDAIVTDVLDSSISNDLRKKYLDASKRESEISSRLGSSHIQAVRLRTEMAEYERLLFAELSRIAESYRSDVDVARSRENDLYNKVTQATSVSAAAGETQVELRELERTADAYRNLYQSFLSRFQEASQQQSFPVTEARVISRATVPKSPSYPKKPLLMALFLVLGAGVGTGIGAFREFRDRFFRTGDQVRENVSLEYLGSAPIVPVNNTPWDSGKKLKPTEIFHLNSSTSYVVDHPMSAFAETMRSVKIALDFRDTHASNKVLGVVSTLPGEGKSTIASNLAELLASQGSKVLLIDADMRNPGATRALGRHAEGGLLEVLVGQLPLENVLMFDEKTRLAFVPAVVNRRIPHSSQLLSSMEMANTLDTARRLFDYVIVDLPPIGPVVDARAISPHIDQFLFVVEWGKTSRKIVRTLIEREREIFEKCVGIVLNKVDPDKMKLYNTYGSSEYYSQRYASYYVDG